MLYNACIRTDGMGWEGMGWRTLIIYAALLSVFLLSSEVLLVACAVIYFYFCLFFISSSGYYAAEEATVGEGARVPGPPITQRRRPPGQYLRVKAVLHL